MLCVCVLTITRPFFKDHFIDRPMTDANIINYSELVSVVLEYDQKF